MLKTNYNPRENWETLPYYKYEAVNEIVGFFNRLGTPLNDGFDANLYRGKINKEPLKRVIYGIRSFARTTRENRQVLEKVKDYLQGLDDWEKIYFFAGVWDKRCIPENEQELNEIVEAGRNRIYKIHYVKKAKGEYIRDIKLPKIEKREVDLKKSQLEKYREPKLEQLSFDF